MSVPIPIYILCLLAGDVHSALTRPHRTPNRPVGWLPMTTKSPDICDLCPSTTNGTIHTFASKSATEGKQ